MRKERGVGDRVLVTGVAGFIGSHLAEHLVEAGRGVLGVDSFTDYYPREVKETNLEALMRHPRFEFVEADLAATDLGDLLGGTSAVCHLAAQAGVRASWGDEFERYIDSNVRATQRLLEAAKESGLSKFVYASSSSVYGQVDELPMREAGPVRPISPYGVTKLAAEHLALLYCRSYGVPVVSLRYFTVYGPRQRPDMAFHKFIRAACSAEPITVFGNGEQTRDFTYVDDVVRATARALEEGPAGEILNIGGGSRVTLNEAIAAVESELGRPIARRHEPAARGDVSDTLADNERARELLGFEPQVSLREGLRRQCDWMKENVL